MIRTVLRSTIHEATVTQADLHYVGSITIDADLMAASGLCEGEQVQVVDVTNGARVVTYAITGEAGSGVIGMNGAAARLVHPGDQVTITGFVAVGDDEPVEPHLVRVDAQNRPAGASPDPAPAVAARPVASVGAP